MIKGTLVGALALCSVMPVSRGWTANIENAPAGKAIALPRLPGSPFSIGAMPIPAQSAVPDPAMPTMTARQRVSTALFALSGDESARRGMPLMAGLGSAVTAESSREASGAQARKDAERAFNREAGLGDVIAGEDSLPAIEDPAIDVSAPRAGLRAGVRDVRLGAGLRLLTTLTKAQVEKVRRGSGRIDHYLKNGQPVRRNMRVELKDGHLGVRSDEIFVVTHSPFREVTRKLQLMPTILRLAERRRREGRNLVLIDWGAGEGRTLATLKEVLDRRGVTNVSYFGFSSQYFPRWETLPDGITMILDAPENLGKFFPVAGARKPVDLIMSHYGLDLLVNTRSRKYPERHKPDHFALLRGLLADDGEIRSTNQSMPLDAIRALGFRVTKIPVRRDVWNKPERESWKLTSYRFEPKPAGP